MLFIRRIVTIYKLNLKNIYKKLYYKSRFILKIRNQTNLLTKLEFFYWKKMQVWKFLGKEDDKEVYVAFCIGDLSVKLKFTKE